MKIKKFRVRNYKSITDSQDCYLSEGITVFAGKNEAGKSSLLEALNDFNPERSISEKAIPIDSPSATPSITVSFDASKEDLLEILNSISPNERLKERITSEITKNSTFEITKKYPNTYEIDGEFTELIHSFFLNEENSIISDLRISIALWGSIAGSPMQTFLAIAKTEADKEGKTDARRKLALLRSELDKISPKIPSEKLLEAKNQLSQIQSDLDQLQSLQAGVSATLVANAIKNTPNIILFSSFEDVFPNEIPFTELLSNSWIADLKAISDINPEIITSSNGTLKKQHKHKLNLQLNSDFSQFWTQDASELSVDWDGNILSFWIEEDGIYYPPELRSQGRRWHLAFYIKVSARSNEKRNNVILIDEPGLYLHAIAQRDILKHLEEASKKAQIVLSTHSPYLIEANKLDRIRLIQKTSKTGTTVENKIHASADIETLTPILTAIGLEINQGIASSEKSNNVIVEGPSDYFYLTGLAGLLGIKNINFISGGGAGNMPKIGTILQGWGCKTLYLYDNDKAFQAAKVNISKDWICLSKDWLMSLNIDGSIEDLFTREEFAHICNLEITQIGDKNSVHMKKNGLDKVLPAKKFLEQIRTGNQFNLSENTRSKARDLLDTLKAKFDLIT